MIDTGNFVKNNDCTDEDIAKFIDGEDIENMQDGNNRCNYDETFYE